MDCRNDSFPVAFKKVEILRLWPSPRRHLSPIAHGSRTANGPPAITFGDAIDGVCSELYGAGVVA